MSKLICQTCKVYMRFFLRSNYFGYTVYECPECKQRRVI